MRSVDNQEYYARILDDEIHLIEAREDREKTEFYISEAEKYRNKAEENNN